MSAGIPTALRELVEHGLHIFPCHAAPMNHCDCGDINCASPGKHPHLSHWQDIATTDQTQIERWMGRYPHCNWGVATGMKSGVLVLDVDPPHGGDETLAAHEAVQGVLPNTWRAVTGRLGEHFYFRHPGGAVKSKNDALGRGLDVKADGGFVIAPSSIHVNGRAYVWNVDHHPDDEQLADCPAWILEALAKHTPTGGTAERPAAVTPDQWRERAEGEIFPGMRTQRITEVCGLLLRKNIEPHLILALLLGWNARSFKPPLPEEKIVKDVAGIMDREAKRRENRNAA